MVPAAGCWHVLPLGASNPKLVLKLPSSPWTSSTFSTLTLLSLRLLRCSGASSRHPPYSVEISKQATHTMFSSFKLVATAVLLLVPLDTLAERIYRRDNYDDPQSSLSKSDESQHLSALVLISSSIRPRSQGHSTLRRADWPGKQYGSRSGRLIDQQKQFHQFLLDSKR